MPQPPPQSAGGHESPGKVRHLYLIETLLGVSLLLLIVALFVSNNPTANRPSQGDGRAEVPQATTKNVVRLTSANWRKEVVESPVPVLVDFWAPWCGPCVSLAPTIDRVAARFEGKIKVGKLNVDEAHDIAAKYGINTIPRVWIFTGGDQPTKMIDRPSETNIVREISSVLQ